MSVRCMLATLRLTRSRLLGQASFTSIFCRLQSLPAKSNKCAVLICPQPQFRTHAGGMFRVQNTDGKARAGALSSAHGNISTPAPLLYSFRGSPLNATPDIMNELGGEAMALHVTATEL